MGIDCIFRVQCYKETYLTHTYTTETPWKEIAELTKQDYMIVRKTNTEVTVKKQERIPEPHIFYHNRLSFIEPIMDLFYDNLDHFREDCDWDFESDMSGTDRFKSTLRVWDALWDAVVADAEARNSKMSKYERPYPIGNANWIRREVRQILEYAAENEGIVVGTSLEEHY